MFSKSALNFLLIGLTSTIAEEKLPLTQEAIVAVYQEYTVHPWNAEARKKLAIYSFKTAVACYRDKQYKESATGCYWALSFDPSHQKARLLLDYLKKKHPEDLEDVVETYE